MCPDIPVRHQGRKLHGQLDVAAIFGVPYLMPHRPDGEAVFQVRHSGGLYRIVGFLR